MARVALGELGKTGTGLSHAKWPSSTSGVPNSVPRILICGRCGRNDVRVAPVQSPHVPLFLPDVGEPPSNDSTRDEPRTRYVGAWNHGFEPHEDTKVLVDANE